MEMASSAVRNCGTFWPVSGNPLDEVEIEEFFNKADLNMDGNINYEGIANSP